MDTTHSLDQAGLPTLLGPYPRRAVLPLGLVFLAILICPFCLRAFNRLALGPVPQVGYLPSLEIRRPRQPFKSEAVTQLQYGSPRWMFIGDSMLGTRIDPRYLGQISSSGDENVGFLYHAATGPAWWYLAFKNQLVASGIHPRVTFFFFRDTNLTDTMFRLEGGYGGALDEVALDREPELDAIVAARRRGLWSRTHALLTRTYELDLAAMWMAPLVRRWYVEWRFPTDAAQVSFERDVEETFGLDHLRPDAASDLGGTDHADFARDLPTSVLPLVTDLAARHDLTICFVRVQRRPQGGQAPADSPSLQTYVSDLRSWLEAQGALFRDDTGDPEMTPDLYSDGDHVRDQRRYTDIFRRRMDPLFR